MIQEKVKELSQAAHLFCELPQSNEDPEICACQRTWKSIGLNRIGGSNFRSTAVPATFSYEIPDTVPDDAKEVFLYARFYTGNGGGITSHFTIYTEEGDDKYQQYITLDGYSSHARWNSNTDNLWFPMPSNRRVFLVVPNTHASDAGGELYVTGYR